MHQPSDFEGLTWADVAFQGLTCFCVRWLDDPHCIKGDVLLREGFLASWMPIPFENSKRSEKGEYAEG